MSFGMTGRFFGQLALCFRQGIPLVEALQFIAGDCRDPEWFQALLRVRDRIAGGEALTDCLQAFPASFARDTLPLLREAENEGLLDLACDVLAAWPDAGSSGIEPCLARALAETSIRVKRGQTIVEAFGAARRPSDPDVLGQALDALGAGLQGAESPEHAMARFPGVFSPAVIGMIRQMAWNGSPEKTFREVALALSRGWFSPEGTSGSPKA